MKSILFCLFLIPAALLAQSPLITFKVMDGKGKSVRVMEPVNGVHYIAGFVEHTLNEKGTLNFPNKAKQPAIYEFFFNREYRLYVRPGQSYIITLGQGDTALTIEAADKEGQLALNRLSFPFYQQTGTQYYQADTVFEHNKKRALEDITRNLAPFASLLEQQKIDKGLYAYAGRLLKNYYASVLASTLMMPMMKTVYKKDSSAYDAHKVESLQKNWQDVLSITDVYDPGNRTVSTYFYYNMFYNQWYLNYFLPLSKGETRSPADFWDLGNYQLIQQYYKEPLKEYLTASWMYFVLIGHQFQPFLVDWYKNFNTRYPKSFYPQALLAEVEKVKQYQAKIQAGFTASQHLIEQADSITTVEQLTGKFKGKTIYLDLWATWCGPCKEQFAYNDSLKHFLQGKGIEVLYVSIDKDAADKHWKDMIKFYNLQGYHIRASKQLSADIYKVFGNKGQLSIPRYALLKDGKIVLPNAKAPGEKDQLYKQLEQYLN